MTEVDAARGVEFWVDPACPWCWVIARLVDGFWELKRTRNEGPQFPPRLDV